MVSTKNYVGGNQYVSQMKKDTLHGEGTYTWADGGKYVGAWKDDKHNGQGTKAWADGNNDDVVCVDGECSVGLMCIWSLMKGR